MGKQQVRLYTAERKIYFSPVSLETSTSREWKSSHTVRWEDHWFLHQGSRPRRRRRKTSLSSLIFQARPEKAAPRRKSQTGSQTVQPQTGMANPEHVSGSSDDEARVRECSEGVFQWDESSKETPLWMTTKWYMTFSTKLEADLINLVLKPHWAPQEGPALWTRTGSLPFNSSVTWGKFLNFSELKER